MKDMKNYEPFFGEWYIERLICENGVGCIYEIRKQNSPDSAQAMKVIRMPDPGLDLDGSYAAKLEVDYIAEINMMTALQDHINVTAYKEFDVLQREDEPGWDIVIRMEMVTPLPEYIRTTPFTIGDAVLMGADVCAMLEACHPHDIVHRNICPQNIFVSANGVFKVGDFALEDPNGQLLSVLPEFEATCYLAPEIYRGEKPVPESDIYSLGLLLYGLLNNNRLPFMPEYPEPCSMADSVFANEKRFRGEPMEPPKNAGERLSAIILKACSFNVEDRYHSASEMKQELNDVLFHTAESNNTKKTSDLPDEKNDFVPLLSDFSDMDTTAIADIAEEKKETTEYEPEFDYASAHNKEHIAVEPVKNKVEKRTVIIGVIAAVLVLTAIALGLFYFLAPDTFLVKDREPSDFSDENESSDASVSSTAGQFELPAVTGMTADEAEIYLKTYGLRVVRKTDYSDTMAEDHVFAQEPIAKTLVSEGDTITISVSLGEAENAITSLSFENTQVELSVGSMYQLEASVEPLGMVLSADEFVWKSSAENVVSVIGNGTKCIVNALSSGNSVVTVSSKDGKVSANCLISVLNASSFVVSDQVGKSKEQAEANLTALGLRVSFATQASDTVPSGYVISQSISEGTSVNAGTDITLVISSGPAGTATSSTTEPVTQTPVTQTPGVQTTTAPQQQTVSVTGVSLNKTSLSLKTGNSETLTATVAPSNATNKNVSYTTSNSGVATVNTSGKVTAVGVGTATVTVSTADGGRTASCTVTVTASTVSVTGVSVSPTSANMKIGVSTTLNVTVSPSNATNKAVTFTSSNTSVATVNASGKVTAVAAGSATITVRTSDGGKSATCSVYVVSDTATVPNVVGKSLSQAKSALISAGFGCSIQYDYSYDGTGLVTSQSPAGSTTLTKGKYVTIYVSVKIVNVTVSSQYGGSVIGGGLVVSGDSTTIQAIPLDGYTFVSWNDGNTSATRVINPTSDCEFIATFAEIQ